MAANRDQQVFDPILLEQLVCPACLGDLHVVEASLVCCKCARIYQILDGIPVLIAERGVPSAAGEKNLGS